MPDDAPSRPRRERSARYPGAPLAEVIDFCKVVDERGLDRLGAAEIAEALGYKNVKTNTFSARLSAARQFGLLELAGDGYNLTPTARAILHPVDPADLPRLRREALLTPPLYTELSHRLADKKVPEPPILANLLYHHHQITAAAKLSAAESFLESARFAGALGPDGVFRPAGGAAEAPPSPMPAEGRGRGSRSQPADVRIDLRLWDADEGKLIRLRAPASITPASFERFLQAFRLHVRIADPPEADA